MIPSAALLAVAVLAGAPVPTPDGTDAGAPAAARDCSLPRPGTWRTIRTRHFSVETTDAGPAPADLARQLEELHAAVLAALVAEPIEVPGRVRVVVLPSDPDVQSITRANVLGLFTVSSLGEPVVVVSNEGVAQGSEVLAHELAHHVSYHLFPWQPRWYAEGLAQFVETVARVDEQGRRWAGATPQGAHWTIGHEQQEITHPESLLRGHSSGAFDRYYPSAWLLYRYLWNEHGKELTEFQRRLSDGERPDAAWRAVFPRWDPAAPRNGLNSLYGELQHHRRNGRGLRYEVKPAAVDAAFTVRPASTADVHLLLEPLRTGSMNALVRERVRDEQVAEALAEDPLHPEALALRWRGDLAGARTALRAAAEARPSDWRAWYLLARTIDDRGEREAALRRAAELAPDAGLPHAALADLLAASGRAREALRHANHGLDLLPWHPVPIAALSAVAAGLGQCPQAILLAERAVAAAEEGHLGGRVDPAPFRARLRDVQGLCAPPPRAAP